MKLTWELWISDSSVSCIQRWKWFCEMLGGWFLLVRRLDRGMTMVLHILRRTSGRPLAEGASGPAKQVCRRIWRGKTWKNVYQILTDWRYYIHIDVKIYWKSSRVLCIRWIHTAGISISGSEKKLELSRISQWKIRTSPSIKFQTHQKTSKSYLDWSIHGSQGSRNPKSSGHSLSV